jgi:hypothetical protein
MVFFIFTFVAGVRSLLVSDVRNLSAIHPPRKNSADRIGKLGRAGEIMNCFRSSPKSGLSLSFGKQSKAGRTVEH